MKRSIWAFVLVVLGFVLVGACSSSSSDDILPTEPNLPQLDDAMVGELAGDVLIPVIEGLNLLDVLKYFPEADMTAWSDRAEALVDCDDSLGAELCDDYPDGGARFCVEDSAADTYVLEFSDCEMEGEEVTGTITVAGSAAAGTGTYDLSFSDGTEVDGDVSYVPEGVAGCIRETFSNFMYDDGDTSATMGGDLIYCPLDAWPQGTLTSLVTAIGFTIEYEMTFDGSSTAGLVATENATGTELTTCTVDLSTADADCS